MSESTPIDDSNYWYNRAIEAEGKLEQMRMDRDGAVAACNKLHEDKRELAAHVERLREALRPFAEFIDAFDAVPMVGIADEFYSINTGTEHEATLSRQQMRLARSALASTPAQSLREVRAEAGRDGFLAGMARATRRDLPPDRRSRGNIADQYAQQIRSPDQ